MRRVARRRLAAPAKIPAPTTKRTPSPPPLPPTAHPLDFGGGGAFASGAAVHIDIGQRPRPTSIAQTSWQEARTHGAIEPTSAYFMIGVNVTPRSFETPSAYPSAVLSA